ncbi:MULTISPECIES: hypothetical protein [Chryseobacterium]|nr:hypothetical protein [Chryseobacterium indologenes]
MGSPFSMVTVVLKFPTLSQMPLCGHGTPVAADKEVQGIITFII